MAHTIYKELERLLTMNKAGFSPKRAAELTHTMYEIEYRPLPEALTKRFILKMDQEQQTLFDIVHAQE